MGKRYLAMWLWLCAGKLKVKTVLFRLPSASQKRACLSSLIYCLMSNISLTRKPCSGVFQQLKAIAKVIRNRAYVSVIIVFAYWRGLASLSIDAYEQMSTDVSDITSIALVTHEMIYNALLINELKLWFTCWELLPKHWLDSTLGL